MMEERLTINVGRLKAWASQNLPVNTLVRELVLTEKDELDVHQFLAMADVWLRLLRSETRGYPPIKFYNRGGMST